MRVDAQRHRSPTTERAVEDEVEPVDVRKLVPDDVALDQPAEVRPYPFGREPVDDEQVVGGVVDRRRCC